jgi:hypothetical protein
MPEKKRTKSDKKRKKRVTKKYYLMNEVTGHKLIKEKTYQL